MLSPHTRAQWVQGSLPYMLCCARGYMLHGGSLSLSLTHTHTLATHARNILADGEKEGGKPANSRIGKPTAGFLHHNKRKSTAQGVPHTKSNKRHFQFGLAILNGAFSASLY